MLLPIKILSNLNQFSKGGKLKRRRPSLSTVSKWGLRGNCDQSAMSHGCTDRGAWLEKKHAGETWDSCSVSNLIGKTARVFKENLDFCMYIIVTICISFFVSFDHFLYFCTNKIYECLLIKKNLFLCIPGTRKIAKEPRKLTQALPWSKYFLVLSCFPCKML